MKKISILINLLILICTISCTEYSNGFTEASLKFDKEFSKAFNSYVYTNQDWGFEELTPIFSDVPTTRSVNTNSNEWANYLEVPNQITEEEREYVSNWFKTHQNPQGEAIHWSDFFIQYVDYSGIGNMDQLGVEYVNGTWEHINDFNVNVRSIKYVYSAGTENWTYRSSFDDKYHYNLYTIQHLVFDINGNHYDGWYVGLDYEAYVYEGDGSLRNGSSFADGYYNDWIVKVTPGITLPSYTTRIMCEDLGNSYDWDYNDVVFDVAYQGNDAIITLQASGGTLPIYIGGYETHALFGVAVNTIVDRPSAPVIFRIPNITSYNPKDIEIKVINTNAIYVLHAEATPQKFACPTCVNWSDEECDIRNTYPKWEMWINDNSIKFWE